MGAQPTAEPTPAPSTEGSVVLDIGGSRGAAIVFTPASLSGLEIEVRPADGPWDGVHTGIRARDLPGVVAHAGVFGSLDAGPYQLRLRGLEADDDRHGVVVDLVVTGGEIVEVEWPTP
jgi:hypothetical protein